MFKRELARAEAAVAVCADRVWLRTPGCTPITTREFAATHHLFDGGAHLGKALRIARKRLRKAGLVRVYNTRSYTWDWPGTGLPLEKVQ